MRLNYISPWTPDEADKRCQFCNRAHLCPIHLGRQALTRLMQADREGEAPDFPRLSRAEVVPSASSMPPSLQLFQWHCSSAHTCLDLMAPVCTPCPGTDSLFLQCLFHPSWHSPVVQLPFLTGHTAHTSPPCPPGPFPMPQPVPSSLAPEGQADAQVSPAAHSPPVRSGCQCDHSHPPPQQKTWRSSPTWTLSANTLEANKAGAAPQTDLALQGYRRAQPALPISLLLLHIQKRLCKHLCRDRQSSLKALPPFLLALLE